MVEMASVIDLIMRGVCLADEIGQLLLSLREKGETVEEIAGAAQAMRKHMTPIKSARSDTLDTCGTGGDASGTFNISTAAALVAAAAGAPVAKHGNRSITSKSGSADVLTCLGVNIEASVETVEKCLDGLGICFCFAPLLHPAMRHVTAIRRELGVPTIFNLLGPLSNPASAPFQLLGVGKSKLRPVLAQALSLLGSHRGVVVAGEDGLDEVTLATETGVTLISPDQQHEYSWSPESFGISRHRIESLRVSSPEESAAVIRSVLASKKGPARDIVVLNAAAAIWATGKTDDLTTCAQLAAEAIDNRSALRLLEALAEMSHA